MNRKKILSFLLVVLLEGPFAHGDLACSEIHESGEMERILEGPETPTESQISSRIPVWSRVRRVLGGSSKLANELEGLFSTSMEFKGLRADYSKEARKLMLNILINSDYEFSPTERGLVNQLSIDDLVARTRAFSKAHPDFSDIYSSLARGQKRVFWSVLMGVIAIKGSILHWPIIAGASAAKVGILFAAATKEIPPLNENQIEIIYNSPAPHTAFRIGETVYSYGVGVVQKYSHTEYLYLGRAQEYGPLYRSSTRVRMNLPLGEVRNLQNYMEGEVGRKYVFCPVAFAFTCVQATHRAINLKTSFAIPAVLDRSPVLSESYLLGRYLLGDKRIDSIYFLKGSELGRIKDIAASVLDAFLGIHVFLGINAIAAQADYFPNSFAKEKSK
ncbi:MAG: hypothetical protein C5B49_01285 [Bdellovibrio sp.]|nr:MAG: hypothetical protein C5B49_01285 [Bdellovibrio sp.]